MRTPIARTEKIDELDRVKQQFRIWRQTRGQKTTIPEELWQAAVNLTHKFPVSVVATHLRLNYTLLKERSQALSPVSVENQNSSPVFVELKMNSKPQMCQECIIEMENRGGDKMRIHMKGDQPIDFNGLCQTFFERR